MPIPLDPTPDAILVSFQADLRHGFIFEIDGTAIPEGMAPTLDLINEGVPHCSSTGPSTAN
jgi:hypothetical protein